MIKSPELECLAGVRHGFLTRRGGVSTGLYSSLNCAPGSGDRRADIIANRTRALARLDALASPLCTLAQVHGRDVVRVDQPWDMAAAPVADAMVTNRAGVALGILTADCAPVLMADTDAGVIGAAHAGWKGALAGIISRTVAAMVEMGARADRITACVGPTIAQGSYEVGAEVAAAFTERDEGDARFFAPGPREGHFMFDLGALVVVRLEDAGVGTVGRLAHDTFADETRFFSYRRACARGAPDYGRQISIILR